ncbi:MAG TPA: tetratricopeptide repeat protein [Candidatus Saccharimonadaceae bacterium]|nr:tetratricopeptide repeat protein [Candidatus Saccharimonadaceae bacterium]
MPRLPVHVPFRVAVLGALLLAGAGGPAPARAQDATAPAAPGNPAAHALAAGDTLADWSRLRLERAAAERSLGHAQGVIDALEPIDFAAESTFADEDRAAFLLGEAYLELGSRARFAALARVAERWRDDSPYARWLAYERAAIESDGGAGAPADSTPPAATGVTAADVLTASLLLRRGDAASALRLLDDAERQDPDAPLTSYLRVRALEAHGDDASAELERLSAADTSSALGRDLAGAALLERAARAANRGEDPAPLLEAVPPGGRYAARARHLLGLSRLEHGDAAGGVALLDSLAAADTTYADRRGVLAALGGQALDAGRWVEAEARYDSANSDWNDERTTLDRLVSGGKFDDVWVAWQSDVPGGTTWPLDGRAAGGEAARLGDAAADLAAEPEATSPPAPIVPAAVATRWAIPAPPESALARVAAAERARDEASYQLSRTRWAVAEERAALERQRGYFALGRGHVADEQTLLAARLSRLDSLRATLDAVDARLRAVRDSASRQIVARARRLLDEADRSALWMQGMRFYHLDPVTRSRTAPTPPGYAGADSVVDAEEALTQGVRDLLARLAAGIPDLIARSYAEAWRPKLIDRVGAERADAASLVAIARGLGRDVDSSLAATASSARLRELVADEARLGRSRDTLSARAFALRQSVARRAVLEARAALDAEREGLDYGLAASAYALAVLDTTADSAGTDAADRPDVAAWRHEAIARAQAFLDRHPQSATRGEMRFRLADLRLVEARARFRTDMAEYLAAQSAGHAPSAVPVLDNAAALTLYRKILAEDSTFAHTDAVLFNAGMILAENGDPDAARYFRELVEKHPTSAYCQEATVRMGDLAFAARDYAACAADYANAATGPDDNLRTIALYKMGWAEFNQDHFAAAADAFRGVLDLYASAARPAIRVDVEHEAESYFTHCMARSGGAPAFAAYFDRVGSRPYEHHLLLALGQHFRRFSLFNDAAASDSLALARFPRDADALLSAERLLDTYQRSNQPALGRHARLTYAPHFVPGSDWAAAQGSDSVRTAGERFARGAWLDVALEQHRAARAGGSLENWRQALAMYETLLAHWPSDAEAPRFELNAGEAGLELGDYATALTHYTAASRASDDSIAALALWQRVAVTDAWYERSRTQGRADHATLGSDSLAHAELRVADELLARLPNHPKAADLRWREGNLALAHGWYERATDDFTALATHHPDDRRAPLARGLGADAQFHLGHFEEAGVAYESTLVAARRAGLDSLARSSARAIPIAYYRAAEASVAADSSNYRRHAELFGRVAERWPAYEHAPLAQYRAGLAYLAAGSTNQGVDALHGLIDRFPSSEYVRDAHLEIARAWQRAGERDKAADAFVAYARHFPADSSARGAWLKAADLHADAGHVAVADSLRLGYIRLYPDDVETAMDILEGMARREIATVGPNHPISALLATPPTKRGAPAAPLRPLPEYLKRAALHPKLASHGLLAQVRFLQGEEACAAYSGQRLRQPLAASIAAKQKSLDAVLSRYKACVEMGDPGWSHAATFRTGQALIGFSEALEQSERPADLKGDDLTAYEDVLLRQAQAFADRGENVWTDLLRRNPGETPADSWIADARGALWHRLGARFYFRPEVDYPLVAATVPPEPRPESRSDKHGAKDGAHARRGGSKPDSPQAQREGDNP